MQNLPPTLPERKSFTELPTKDWNYSIQLSRLFLKSIGAWPLSLNVTFLEKMISISLTTISSCLIGFLLIPCALVTFLVRESVLNTKIKIIGPLSFCVMAAIKYYILTSRGMAIAKCVKHVRSDWERAANLQEDRKIVIENAEFGRSLVISCAAFMYGAGIFFCTVMPLCARRTEIIDNQTIRVPSFPIYRKLIDPRTSPYFEIVQFLQCLAGYVIYSITISACSLLCIFVTHACGQFKVLMRKLDDLVVGEKQSNLNSSDERLGDIVEHHLRILDFIAQIEKLFNEICFVELVGCTLNICFLGYNMMMEWEHRETIGTVTYCSLLISFTFNIFILCYIGELLVEQCENVGVTSYMIKWYRLPKKKALDLTLLIAVSNAPLKLTAGKLFELSLVCFCSVIKSATAYLNMLRTFTY
ncbi:odorant receptor 9a-like [Polistes fuscatus]|uniref:odorant receptor 9a-like n=1 Tax=Polistes fuscatus TaxID=30207 RepID=UPI001CA9F209|nr:odorant receptor 9a-like [Polistes fuscatus]